MEHVIEVVVRGRYVPAVVFVKVGLGVWRVTAHPFWCSVEAAVMEGAQDSLLQADARVQGTPRRDAPELSVIAAFFIFFVFVLPS